LGVEGVRALLGSGRKDASGDFTPGADLKPDQSDAIIEYTNLSDTAELQKWFDNIAVSGSFTSIVEMRDLSALISRAGYSDRVKFDPSVVRGLEYYTGPVFEAFLTFEIPNEQGQPVVFGSVGGGGRYDGLVGRFRGEDVPATGFSVGVSRLAAALKALRQAQGKLGDEEAVGPVVVTVMDRERLADYQTMVAELRNSGIAAEMYLGPSGMKAQLKYADKRNAPAAVIAGSQEFESGKLQIKDLVAGKEKAAAIANHATWREERPGQVEIPRADLVAEVRKLLDKQRRG
jgi:histidyl-tRNA synthetase